MEELKCAYCLKQITMNYYRKHRLKKGKILTCNYVCAAKWRMSQPGMKEKINAGQTWEVRSSRMKSYFSSEKGVLTRKTLSERMKKQNPMNSEEVREVVSRKMKIANPLRKIPKGGNGRGMTVPQEILAKMLGWETEYILKTGAENWEPFHCPRHYKLDIANPELKMAVEVDGPSHNSPSARERDRKKEMVLKKLGWKVIRIKNKEILENPEWMAFMAKGSV